MKKKFSKSNLPRIVIQWSVIGFMIVLALLPFIKDDFTPDFEAYCPFGGVQALSSYLLNNSLACTMTSVQISMGVLLIIGIILFSKLFCAYICPIGTISEWLGKMGERLKVRITLKGAVDKLFRSVKYVLLFITFYYTLGSSELFCKKFDPYYAVATGFSMDVVLLYAALAIALVIIGSVFIRLLWCKYICPFGAISNIFKFSWFFIAVIGIFILLRQMGFAIHYAWPLGVATFGGYLLEIFGEKLTFTPAAKITRNELTCTDCQLCSRRCPQAIDVASMKVVKDVDCNLCNECVVVCPVKDTIQINKRSYLKWLPPIATVALFIIGLILSSIWEVPTIDQRWVDQATIEKSAVFKQSGLKNIKCFGSSMAFASQMKQVEGVRGVATYVATNTVKIYYDPEILNDVKIQAKLFTPMKTALHIMGKENKEVKVASMLVDKFFDPMDFTYLSILLREKTDALGVESEFECPVRVRIFFPANSTITEEELIAKIESKSLTVLSAGKSKTIDLQYKVVNKIEYSTISAKAYVEKMFQPYQKDFNSKSDYKESVLDTLKVPLGENKYNTKTLPYLISHLSNDNGVIEFKSVLDSSLQIAFEIVYVDSITNKAKIEQALKRDSLSVTYSDGEAGKIVNMYKF
jgi:polyferredoxin